MADESAPDWEKVATVVSRSLAFLCLQSTPIKDGTLLAKANFLAGLGVPYADAAGMLGTTADSLGNLARQAKAKGKKRGKEAKSKSRPRTRKRKLALN